MERISWADRDPELVRESSSVIVRFPILLTELLPVLSKDRAFSFSWSSAIRALSVFVRTSFVMRVREAFV